MGEYGNVPGSGTKYKVTEKVVTVFSHRNFALVEFVARIAQKLVRGYLVRQKLRKQKEAEASMDGPVCKIHFGTYKSASPTWIK